METETETDTESDMETDRETDMDMDMDKDTDMELEYFCWGFPYGTIVAIAPYGLPVTHHGASSDRAINLLCHFQVSIMTFLF